MGCRGLPGCSIMRAFLPFANIGVLRAGHAQPVYLLTPAGRFALRATAHRADAPLRRAHGFAALANIGVLCAGRAQPLYLLTPSGRFGPSAQVPTGHTLPVAPCRGLGQTPGRSIVAEGAGCAHRSFRGPPSGRFALRATAHWADASLRPLQVHSYRPAPPGGRGVCAKGANIPYAGRRPAKSTAKPLT